MATILIVDDDATIRTFLCRILEEDGHEVREAANEQVGLRMYRQDPTDLVITDILMPERDGMEVTLALTREFMEANVITTSGATDARSLLDIAIRFDARHVIQKPFTAEEIRRLVRFTLEQ